MTPKVELFGRIEDYCLELLDAQERIEFEKELEFNEELRDEVELHKNIQAAITEMDVLDLKSKLENIQSENKPESSINGSFELLDELTLIQDLSDELAPEELINSLESLPKVHVYQHELTSNENIHHFYKEQNKDEGVNGREEDLNGFDMEGLEGLEEAVLETDILNLRETLQHVAKSVEPQYSVEDIDDFLNGELGDDILAEFELELEQNEDLQDEVILHSEIEAALKEEGVMNLRSELRNIMDAETSWNVSEKSIEDFIDGILEDELLEEFNAELKENTDLMAEVALREHINEAIAETDIQSLRAGLRSAQTKVDKKEVKSIVMPRFERGTKHIWRTSAAMIIVLIGLAGILNTGLHSTDNTYNRYFESPTWASERSVSSSIDNIQMAKVYYQTAEYQKVVDLLNNTKADEDQAFVSEFYKGLSYQNLDRYENAIQAYTKVIDHGNNLFIEEAEWYKSLCYLKLNQKSEAKLELIAVIDRKGHYEKDAKAILRRLRYSFK
uniref:tetratricopeptide repeat protein n=1 Tax=uncultured Draconibacterium sp. TaxID=1573823 RepID=UPI00321704F2